MPRPRKDQRCPATNVKPPYRDGADHYKPGGLVVESHWNDQDRVVLVVDGKRYTVIASDLADAAERARRPR